MRSRAWGWWWIVSVALFASCRCPNEGVTGLEPAEIVATPSRFSFPATYVGQRTSSTIVLTNRGGESASLALSIDEPFIASADQLVLTRGQSEAIEINFAPTHAASFSSVLRVGTLEIPVDGVGLEVPECVAPSSCISSQFDFDAETCRETNEPDGTACETSCITGGCIAGECIGGIKGCDDSDACTIDACSETSGCSHVARVCPTINDPCKVAFCDPVTGCGAEPVPDGTLCGLDECRALQVDVCIAGECVQRPRPMTGRCANRWVPTTIPNRVGPAMAYDRARRRVVLFGGGPGPLDDTWERDGQRWLLRTPAASPPARTQHAMAWDPIRQRVVLFGGLDANDQPLNDTWEWDGSNWVQRRPAISPPARSEHALVLDEARQRIVLISGRAATGLLQDVWEWNGATWTSKAQLNAPTARRAHAAAYDPDRQRIVLFGGVDQTGFVGDTWEWDGVTWIDRSTQQPIWVVPSARAFAKMAYDSARRCMLLVHGVRSDGSAATDTWEWDGTYWGPGIRFSGGDPVSGLALDTDRQRFVLYAGQLIWDWDGDTTLEPFKNSSGITGTGTLSMVTDPAGRRVLLFLERGLWEWSGDSWTFRSPYVRTPQRLGQAMAWDATRQRLVLFGGLRRAVISDPADIFDDTWEWDSQWLATTPSPRPPGRGHHAMIFDSTRQQVLLVGGTTDNSAWFSDTWSWDGTSWTLRSSMAPSLDDPSFAYDEARQRAVLFGAGQTWTWDGQQWQQAQPPSSPPARSSHSMAWDPSRQRVLLFSGLAAETWEWDGATWLQRTPLTSPPPNDWHAMAFDPIGQRMVLYAGGVTWLFLP